MKSFSWRPYISEALSSISYIDIQTIKPQELYKKIVRVAKNVDIYSNIIHNYYVGFPSNIEDDKEDDPNTPMVTANIPYYNHETKETVHFLNQNRLKSIAKINLFNHWNRM